MNRIVAQGFVEEFLKLAVQRVDTAVEASKAAVRGVKKGLAPRPDVDLKVKPPQLGTLHTQSHVPVSGTTNAELERYKNIPPPVSV